MEDLALPSADVLWWTDQDVRVRCPYCTKTHRHGILYDHRYQANHCTRIAHCGAPLEITGRPYARYRFMFPFDKQGHIAFEIDKEKARFVNVGVEQEAEPESQCQMEETDGVFQQAETDDDNELAEQIQRKLRLAGHRIFSEASRTYDLQLPGLASVPIPLINLVISDCILGDVAAVKTYLDTASAYERGVFLRGKDGERNGSTALIYAATEQTSRLGDDTMVSLLLERGADVNAANFDGRTALMEASLWGRADNVRLLLKAGADKDMIDEDGYTAVDFASPSARNEEERYNRSGSGRIYKEITFEANQARRNIVGILRPISISSGWEQHSNSVSQQYDHLSRFEYDRNSRSLVYLSAEKVVQVQRESKTVARLERGHPFASIFAKSGWSRDETATVNGRQATDEVFELARMIGYHLPHKVRLDQGRPGQFSACHAEKQLLAFLASRHRFSQADIEEHEKLSSLFDAQPPVELRKAKLLVSRPTCEDCTAFIKLFEQKTEFTIEVRCTKT